MSEAGTRGGEAFEAAAALRTDYSARENWLAWPEKPLWPLDVFYLYPTAWEAQSGQPPLCPAAYRPMRRKARFFLAYQAAAFAAAANLHAPYYRQLDARFLLGAPCQERRALLRGAPWEDVRAAFEAYLAGSGSRPFILAGHSQGAGLIKELVFGYLKTRPALRRRLVAAYVVGFPVTWVELAANPEFPFAGGDADTGVVISYNVEGPAPQGPNPFLAAGAAAINPISWTLSEEPAGPGLGSYLIDRLGRVETRLGLADARVDAARGVVVCSSFNQEAFFGPGFEKLSLFPSGVLHAHDIALYYHDLRADAERRARLFLN